MMPYMSTQNNDFNLYISDTNNYPPPNLKFHKGV